MSKSQNRTVDKHIIWSDMNLNPDDWRDSYKDFLEINEIDGNPNDEHGLYEYMVETNGEYLSDERENLNVQLAQPIIVIGDIGRWNGRVMGYKMIDSGNIKDCLYSDTDMTEWYVDRYGDLRADAVHHDGTNHYLYRVFKDTASPEQIERLQEKIYYGKATRADITRVTKRLGDEIAAVYGFHIPKQRTAMEQARRENENPTASYGRTKIHLQAKYADRGTDRKYRLSAWRFRRRRQRVLFLLV